MYYVYGWFIIYILFHATPTPHAFHNHCNHMSVYNKSQRRTHTCGETLNRTCDVMLSLSKHSNLPRRTATYQNMYAYTCGSKIYYLKIRILFSFSIIYLTNVYYKKIIHLEHALHNTHLLELEERERMGLIELRMNIKIVHFTST